MAKYEKPMVIANDELAEGVFAASGCYTVTAGKHQENQEGKTDVRFWFSAVHAADHSCSEQYLTVNFTKPVKYVSSNGTLYSPASADTQSYTIVIKFNYWNNPDDNIGAGDFVVFGDSDVEISSISMSDNGK